MTSHSEEFLNAALQIGLKICCDAIHDGDRCNWINSNMDETSGYPKTYFHSLGPELYSGTSGVGFFLASLHSVCPDPIIKSTAAAAIRQSLSRESLMDGRLNLAVFAGRLGIAYAAIRAGEKLHDEGLLQEGISLATRLAEAQNDDPGLDIIEGCAGAIPVFLRLYQQYPNEIFKSSAIRAGEFIISAAKTEVTGCSWDTASFKKHNLTGYAHGAAGLATSLLEIFRATDDKKYADMAAAGIAYENRFFSEAEKNWPDFRVFPNMPQPEVEQTYYSCAWCHGAPGIGLSRLRAYEITGNDTYMRDAMAAIETTRNRNHMQALHNFSLCHGLFGNAELFLEASQKASTPPFSSMASFTSLREEAEKPAILCISDFIEPGIPLPNGINNSFDNPELMTGTAGMGYYFLRLFDAEAFPSILLI